MGWWSIVDGDNSNLWGDGPADILDEALDSIVAQFMNAVDRKPTKREMLYGFKMALSGIELSKIRRRKN
jgi:hypothetical protein